MNLPRLLLLTGLLLLSSRAGAADAAAGSPAAAGAFLVQALNAQAQLARSQSLDISGRYKVAVLDGYKAVQRWRHYLFRSMDKKPVLDDARWQEYFVKYIAPWPCDTPLKGSYQAQGRLLEANGTNEYWDGTYYARKNEQSNQVELSDETLAEQIPDYLAILYTVNGEMEVGKDSARNWSKSSIPLATLVARALESGSVEGSLQHLKLTILGHKGNPKTKLLMEIITVPGKPYLVSQVKAASCPAATSLPIDKLAGTTTSFDDYQEVAPNLFLPRRIKAVSYTSTAFELTESQRDSISQHMVLPDASVTVPMIEHAITLDSISLATKQVQFKMPIKLGTQVHDRILNKKYIFGQDLLDKAKEMKGSN